MKDIRNVAIIAHVDHGKTTLVDGLLKQSKTFRDNEAEMSQELIMDSNDQERERGITILAKNTAINYNDTKINIIDTPGHADFGGEVERTLNMADGAILVVDAQEGPMPQTRFVLKKALELGLKIIVVINKIDKKNAQIDEVLNRTSDLFLDLAQNESQLDFPVFYAIGREGKSWDKIPEDTTEKADLSLLFKAILDFVPAPKRNLDGTFQMLVSALDWDDFRGKYAIGKIIRGIAKPGLNVSLITKEGIKETAKIDKVFVSSGLKRQEADLAESGDIIAITGIKKAGIGETIADATLPEALPGITIEEPTLSMAISANTSPFAGREGQFVTGRQILDRIKKELETNVSMKLNIGENGQYILSGRGELHLSVFIETLRREGYELQVGKPQVVTKIIDNELCEPIEELTIESPDEFTNNIIAEVIRRKGTLISQDPRSDGTSILRFEITTRGILGLRSELLTLSKGTAVANSIFLRFAKAEAQIPKLRNGVLIASETGKAVTYGLNNAQERGITFVEPQTEIYQGMIVGVHSRENDLDVNVAKEKKLTNTRSSTADIAVILTPATKLSLEQCIEFLEDDELLEVTPKSLRLRKKIIDPVLRRRAKINNTGLLARV
jgi:GTP-binding protein